MALSAIYDGGRIIAPMLSNAEWQGVVQLSKQRLLKMPGTRLPAMAKTLRWNGGITRFFSHFPGEAPEGYGNEESPEHEAMKFAVYLALLKQGYPVTLEEGMDDWRADVLVGVSSFGPALAIEVQLTRQSAELTYQRTAQRSASNVPTLWIFGPASSTGVIGHDLLQSNPVFSAVNPEQAADTALAVCCGSAYFDDLSDLASVPARPVARKVECACGVEWLLPEGVVLLPNRVRGDLAPEYCSAVLCAVKPQGKGPSLKIWQAGLRLSAFDGVFSAAAQKYRLKLGVGWGGNNLGRLWRKVPCFSRDFGCPSCGTPRNTIAIPSISIERTLCPVPVSANVDARARLTELGRVKPQWRLAPVPPYEEPTMSMADWKDQYLGAFRKAQSL
ncbi:competence protein CoiA [Pseudomonas aeruginosa]|nr:competence protein CoiA family protein [Pseudomonas aeruginosa]MBW6123120.1 competence protein CoiA [Pseudomonas aeruginosa]